MTDLRKNTKKVGRKKSQDPAIYRYVMKLNAVENAKFTAMFLKSGLKQKSQFLKSVVFSKEIRIVKVDKSTMDYYMRLTNFYAQYQAIGVNYNQIVKALKTNFNEKRALVLLHQLEQATFKLIAISQKVIELTHEYEKKWLKNDSKDQ